MSNIAQQSNRSNVTEIYRYIINGLLATAIHYAVLTVNITKLGMYSAGFANLIAAMAGISVSFLGNRYFVFRKRQQPLLPQAAAFGLLYISIACVHGLVLYGWTDIYQFDYRPGFIIAMTFQVTLSYWGNKNMVFRA